MKTRPLIAILILSFSSFVYADTGDFKITNNSFKELFNTNDGTGVVKPTPWAGSFWAYGSNGIADPENRGQSPAQKYDAWAKQGDKATKWELENHSCKNVDAELKKGCKDWWGHCNAWSAAAVSHEEPRTPKTISGIEFGVADQKAFLTEIWMASGSLFAGGTNKSVKTGKWVCDPDSKIAKETDDYGNTNYDLFWDMSPRSFFLILTNYVGLRNSGIVIDRFTGDEVWNQPIVGYRFEPLTQDNVGVDPETEQNFVQMEVTIYWAHDGVEGDFLSAVPFDIQKIDQLMGSQAGYGSSYDRRTLKFKLFFSGPVKISGGKVASSGRLVGDGLWDQQENCPSLAELDQGHPDFVWRPTDLESDGDANPYISSAKVMKLLEGQSSGGGSGGGSGGSESEVSQGVFKVTFSMDYLSGRTDLAVRRYIKKIFKRAGIDTIVDKEMKRNGRRVFSTVTFPENVDQQQIIAVLEESGAVSVDVKPVGV